MAMEHHPSPGNTPMKHGSPATDFDDTANAGKSRGVQTERQFSLAELQELYANIPGSFSIMNAEGKLIAWNAFMREEIVGGSEETMHEVDGFSTIHPDDRALMAEYFTTILRDGREIIGEARVLLRGGPDYVWRALHGKRIIIDREPCVMAIGADIDKQKRLTALQAFRLRMQEVKDHTGTEGLLKLALDEAEKLTGSRSGFCSFTPEEHSLKHLMVWSTGAEKLFGSIDMEDAHLVLKDIPLFDTVVREQKPVVVNDFPQWSRGNGMPGHHGLISRLMVIPLMGRNGVAALFGLASKQSDFSDSDMLLVRLLAESAWDIINRKRSEESEKNLQKYFREFQAEGLVARIASRAVDEFNAMLSLTLENTEELLGKTPEGTHARDLLETIQHAAARNIELAAQLVTFAEKQPGNPDMLNVNAVIDGMFEMLENLLPESVTLDCDLQEEELWARMDPGQLELVLMNLFMNALEAIENCPRKSGSITVKSESYRIDSAEIRVSGAIQTPGDYIRITVADTGCGIASEMVPHIFDPFFTTKEGGSQKGLGLSTVYGLVRQSNGCVEVETEEEKGTTMHISLPRAKGVDIPLRL